MREKKERKKEREREKRKNREYLERKDERQSVNIQIARKMN